jgi:hypothetical protein
MPFTSNINRVQMKTTQSNTDKGKNKNSTIQPAYLTNPTNSNISPIISSERSSYGGNVNNPADDEWITYKSPKNSKRILSSSSSDASYTKTPPTLNKKLFTTRNRFETLNQN